jgi:uncharacterized protein YutE (UPF0331/DUF86 family)
MTEEPKRYFMRFWPLYVVALLAAGVIAARMKWPSLIFDNTSLILFAIGSISILLPFLFRGLPPLKRFKFGEYEIEFEEKLRSLESKVIQSEHELKSTQIKDKGASTHLSFGWQEYYRDYNSIISSSVSNVEKILAAANVVERIILDTAQALDLVAGTPRKNTRTIIVEMKKQGLITEAEQEAFIEFSNIRNDVVHGNNLNPSESQTARFLDLGWRLVRTFV